MSEYTGHNGDAPSSIAGIADTGSMVANSPNAPSGKGKNQLSAPAKSSDFVRTAKRESMKHTHSQKQQLDDMRFLTLVYEMGRPTLEKPFIAAQLDDLRQNNKPDGYHSATLVWAIIAGAKTLPYASETAMDLLAANSPDLDIEPIMPHLELDEAA